MGELFLELLPVVIGLMITPGAVIGAVLLLHSARPVPNAAAFGGGFLVVYGLIAISAVLVGASEPGATSEQTSHRTGLAVGLGFLAAGVWLLIRKPRTAGQRPRLLSALETASPRRAFAIGVLLGVLNPNLFLMIAGMTTIASSTVGATAALVAVLLLLVAAAADFAVPIALYLALGERAERALDVADAWMLRYSRTLTLAVLFGFGALFTVRGVVALST
ncbi:GAP family protein [Nocardia sp. NPDC004415]